MTAEVATTPNVSVDLLERTLITSDISRLSATERLTYYRAVCESVGLNPLTRPFDYLTLNGKTILYAKRDATDQLRKLYRVSVRIVARERLEDVYVVTAQASMPDGRVDESIGAVNIGGLKGEALANAFMKTETKAKRRVTMSICGLGMLDETEVDTIPGARVEHVMQSAPTPMRVEPPKQLPAAQLPPLEPVTDWEGNPDPTPHSDAQLEADLDAAFRAQAPPIRFPRNAPGMQEFIKLVELARPNGLGLDADARKDALGGKSVNKYMTDAGWQDDPAALDRVWALLEARVLATEAAEVAATE